MGAEGRRRVESGGGVQAADGRAGGTVVTEARSVQAVVV